MRNIKEQFYVPQSNKTGYKQLYRELHKSYPRVFIAWFNITTQLRRIVRGYDE